MPYKWIVRESTQGHNNDGDYSFEPHISAQGIKPTRKEAIETARANLATSKQVYRVWKIKES